MKRILRNIILSIIAFLIIIIINFFLPRLISGNPLNALAGLDGNLNETVIKELTIKYGLDQPLINQFFIYLGNIFRFDLGYSYQSNLDVRELIYSRIGNTLEISFLAVLISLIISYFIASRAGFKKDNNHLDRVFSSLSTIVSSLPGFMISMLIVLLFAVTLKIFPLSGLHSVVVPTNPFLSWLDRVWHLVLPITSLVIIYFPANYFLIRNLVIKEKEKRYVSYLVMKNEKRSVIIDKAIFPNIAGTLIIETGLRFSLVFGGSLVIENIFSINGVGTLLYNSVYKLDYPLIQGILIVSSFFAVIVNILFETIGTLVDARIRRNLHEN